MCLHGPVKEFPLVSLTNRHFVFFSNFLLSNNKENFKNPKTKETNTWQKVQWLGKGQTNIIYDVRKLQSKEKSISHWDTSTTEQKEHDEEEKVSHPFQ